MKGVDTRLPPRLSPPVPTGGPTGSPNTRVPVSRPSSRRVPYSGGLHGPAPTRRLPSTSRPRAPPSETSPQPSVHVNVHPSWLHQASSDVGHKRFQKCHLMMKLLHVSDAKLHMLCVPGSPKSTVLLLKDPPYLTWDPVHPRGRGASLLLPTAPPVSAKFRLHGRGVPGTTPPVGPRRGRSRGGLVSNNLILYVH